MRRRGPTWAVAMATLGAACSGQHEDTVAHTHTDAAGGSAGAGGSGTTGGTAGTSAGGSGATGGSAGAAAGGGGGSGAGAAGGAAGGAGAPSDAGADAVDGAGGGGACTSASECPAAADGGLLWCGPVASCIAGRCVEECPLTGEARTCSFESDCLSCGSDAGSSCAAFMTCSVGLWDTTVEATTCTAWPDGGGPVTAVQVMRTASAACHYLLSNPADGEILGQMSRLESGEAVIDAPGWGGVCTARSAFTGAPRFIITCPDCSLVLMGFE